MASPILSSLLFNSVRNVLNPLDPFGNVAGMDESVESAQLDLFDDFTKKNGSKNKTTLTLPKLLGDGTRKQDTLLGDVI